MPTDRSDRIKSQIDRLRTQARKLNVEFSDATAKNVRIYLERRDGDLPKLEMSKYGTIIYKRSPH